MLDKIIAKDLYNNSGVGFDNKTCTVSNIIDNPIFILLDLYTLNFLNFNT